MNNQKVTDRLREQKRKDDDDNDGDETVCVLH